MCYSRGVKRPSFFMDDLDRVKVIHQMVEQMDSAKSTEWNIYEQSGRLSKKIVIEYETEVKTWK